MARVIIAYEMDDGRNLIGSPYTTDIIRGVCKLRNGFVIRKEDIPQGRDYAEFIREMYPKSRKIGVIPVRLEKIVKPHRIILE